MFNIVSIEQKFSGHARQAGLIASQCQAGLYANRYTIVVDDDIDPTDTNEVLWAMCTRTDVAEDVDILKRLWSTSLDPMAYAGDGNGARYYNNRMIIDACRPYDRLDSFPPVVRKTQEEAQAMRAQWPELFTPDGKVRKEAKRAAH